MTSDTEPRWPCPCCGYLVFSEPPGSYEICPVCGWEDDLSQLRFAAATGANHVSLVEAQLVFAVREQRGDNESGRAPEELGYVRDPTWRRVDSDFDRIEIPRLGQDYGRRYAADHTAYYYWRQTDPRDWRLDVAESCIELYLELSERPRPIKRVETEMLLEVIDAWRAHEHRKHIALMRALGGPADGQ